MGIGLDEFEERLAPLLSEEGAELLEAHVSRSRNSIGIRLFIDRLAGIGVADLARISRRIGLILDADPALAGRYSLEVSSPGMNRVVRNEAHFQRFVGERVNVWTFEPRDGRTHFEGTIEGCSDGRVAVMVDHVGRLEFVLNEIKRAELRLDPRRPPGTPGREPAERRNEVPKHGHQ